MSMQGRIGRAGGTRVKRALGVQAALEWVCGAASEGRERTETLSCATARDANGQGSRVT